MNRLNKSTITGMVNFSRPDITQIACFATSIATQSGELVFTHKAVKP